MFGLDANIIQPPFSALVSILLVIACDFIGSVFIWKFLKIDTIEIRWIRWQGPIIGVAFLSVFIFPMALFGFAHRNELRLVALFMLILSFIHIFFSFKSNYPSFLVLISKAKANFALRNNYFELIILIFIVGYALLSLGPVTSADSLDYHIGVPIEILNSGAIYNTPEWFHSRLSGSGEVLNALGLSVGAEQFGSLLQFIALIGIIGLILDSERKDKKKFTRDRELTNILATLILSTPVIIFLVSSSKFQLLPVSMTSLALCLIVFPSRRNLSSSETIKGFFLVCILVMVASQTKLNYLLSGGVVGLIALTIMYRKKLIWQSTVIGLFVALIIIAPVLIIKSQLYESGYIEALFSPFPGNFPGLDLFERVIRNGQDSNVIFPFSLILPSGIGSITTILGVGVLFIAFIRPNHDNWIILLLITLMLVFALTVGLGPRSSRSYLEPYFWSLIAISLQNENILFEKLRKFIKPIVLMQSISVILLCWYGVATLSPGGISTLWRDNVMNNSANGYAIMKWADEVLPSNAVLLTAHRSMALVPRKSVSLDWLFYVEPGKTDISRYIERIKKNNVTHILLSGSQINQNAPQYIAFSNCLGFQSSDAILEKEFVYVTRNPFNTGSINNIKIFEFHSEKLPNCLSDKFK
jgi:hypothetical protein